MAITPQEAAKRLADAGLQFGDRYVQGASGKGSKMASAAAAAEPNYEQGVMEGIKSKRYGAGVRDSGAAYDAGVQSKGRANFMTGLAASESKYVKGVAKVAGLWGQPLSVARGPRRSAANEQRMLLNKKRFQEARS